jgi:hypothetical protein
MKISVFYFSIHKGLSVSLLAVSQPLKVLQCDGRGETDNKWAGLRILDRNTPVQ